MPRRSRQYNPQQSPLNMLARAYLGAIAGAPELTTEAAAFVDPSGFEAINDIGPVIGSQGQAIDAPPTTPPTQLYEKPSKFQSVFNPEGAQATQMANREAVQEVFNQTARDYFARKAQALDEQKEISDIANAEGISLEEARKIRTQMGAGTFSGQGTAGGRAMIARSRLGQKRDEAALAGTDPEVVANIQRLKDQGESLAQQAENRNIEMTSGPRTFLEAQELNENIQSAPLRFDLNRQRMQAAQRLLPAQTRAQEFELSHPPASAPGYFNLELEPLPPIADNPSYKSSMGLGDFLRGTRSAMDLEEAAPAQPEGPVSLSLTPEQLSALERYRRRREQQRIQD